MYKRQKIQFTRATYYLSKPTLYDENETVIPVSENYFLVHHDTETLFIDPMTTSQTIDSIAVNIGVDASENNNDPALQDNDSPLAFQSPSMHWGWTNGYLFMVIEGTVDTDGNGILDDVFAFHIGLNSNLREIRSASGLNIEANSTSKSYLTFEINYDQLFTGIDLSTDNSTHTMDNPSLAATFLANQPVAITLK